MSEADKHLEQIQRPAETCDDQP